ncbi:MAG: sigma-54-dependent Fis family transcriptional regulator [Candidatus Hydrogenedentes bacterium]|nr:sigma-54-dependent Fis family transcriptional regulator [Candidatus Hydrogenedentota bacterium]
MDKQPAAQVLVVDHHPASCRAMTAWLRERGHAATGVDNGEKAFNQLDARPWDALVTELHAGRVDGMRLMSVALARHPDLCAVLTATEAETERAVEAMRLGAHDFLLKPVHLPHLGAVLERGLAHQQLLRERVGLQRRLDERFGLGGLSGRSRQMTRVYQSVRQAGPLRDPLLVFGEAGTGKELIAEAVHHAGPWRDGPFVKADAAALPRSAQAAALFGEGGAGRARRGLIEQAEDGTLFLDNADALDTDAQDRLLAWLETGAAPRAGDGKKVPVSARLVAATRKSPVELAGNTGFNPALAERLCAVTVEAPALRQRPEDIPLLARDILERLARADNREPRAIEPGAVDLLLRYDWPGNVRELETVLEGMDLTAGPGPLRVAAVPPHVRRAARPARGEIRVPVGVPMAVIERAAIEETLRHCDYDKAECARILGIGLRTLYRKLGQYTEEDGRG